ncbi:MAG TPA: hypothetical protein VFB16_08545 [Bauldia sp.]|nr:hypothetical protein [Bauldia sp.]
MILRSLLGAIVIAAAIPSVSLAATSASTPKPDPSARCTSLEQQFADAAKANPKAKKLGDAQKLADAGTKLCTDKKYSQGERKLTQALADLGVKPKT